jgi:hypothetical protein
MFAGLRSPSIALQAKTVILGLQTVFSWYGASGERSVQALALRREIG